jgi:hypothetical protein
VAYNDSDWNAPIITCLFLLLRRLSRHYADNECLRLRAGEQRLVQFFMMGIRLYIFALTLLFLVLVIANQNLGILEAIIITCATVYLILDVRTDLQSSRAELQLLKELEKQVSVFLRS